MKDGEKVYYGISITVVIFAISAFIGKIFYLKNSFLTSSFGTHSLMLILSLLAIYVFSKNMNYIISIPEFKKILRPVLFGMLASIIVGLFTNIIVKLSGGIIEMHPALMKMSPLQVLVFVFFYASIAEELLFRGFLMNILAPYKFRGIIAFKRKISIPVAVSGIAFGLAHLILIASGVGILFLIRIVIFTTVIGFIAGYYQEKHNNNAYAIIVHMAGNSIAVIGAFLTHLNV
jgi:membrane protease YdiL (CAAX protease family)